VTPLASAADRRGAVRRADAAPLLLAPAVQQSIDISCLPVHSSKPAARCYNI